MAKIERPVNTLQLPSKGLLYEGKVPQGFIEYNPMTGKEEKILAGGNVKGGSVIDTILKSCLPTLPIPVGELLSSDRFFILTILRSTSYGSEYSFDVKCPECSQKWKHQVSLTDADTFPVKLLSDDAQEPFLVTLPVCKKEIGFRLLRGDDEKNIQRYTDQQYAKGAVQGDPSYIYGVAKRIITIDGEDYTNRLIELIDFVETLIGKDSRVLRKAMDDADCGLNIRLHFECPRCGDSFEQGLPLTAEFFRP